MKKIVVLLLTIFFCAMAYCQDSKLIAGVELMPSLTWCDSEFSTGIHPRPVLSGGLSIEYCISPVFSIKSGLDFVRKGAKTDTYYANDLGDPISTAKLKTDYDYLVIPLLASFTSQDKTKVFINIGPYAGYLLSCALRTSKSAGFPKHKVVYTPNIQKFDFGLSGGIGVRIPFGEKLLLDIAGRADLALRELDGFANYSRPASVGLLVGMSYRL